MLTTETGLGNDTFALSPDLTSSNSRTTGTIINTASAKVDQTVQALSNVHDRISTEQR